MKLKYFFAFTLGIFSCFSMDPRSALETLIQGNQRYATDQLLHPNRSSDRREELVKGQNPFAAIVACSDSRVPPEIIFDQGIGDLFIVRIAGNVVGPIELDSIDYAAKVLGSSLIVVMGHESCGAVSAVLQGKTEDIQEIADLIEPAIKQAKNLESAVKANVRWTVDHLKKTPLLKKMIKEKKIGVIGAYYDLGTGKIAILDSL